MKICTAGTPLSMKLFWSDDSRASGIIRPSTPVTKPAPRKMCCHSEALPVAITETFLSKSRPTVSRLMTPIVFSSGKAGCST